MDEPTSGLDYNNMIKVSDFIRESSKEKQTFLVASHDFEFLACTCTHICFLGDGEVRDYFKLDNNTLPKLLAHLFDNYENFTNEKN